MAGWLGGIVSCVDPGSTLPGGAAVGSNPTELFAEGQVHEIALTLTDAARRSLEDDPGVEVEALLAWRSVEYPVGVAIKGSASFRPIDEKPSFKIDVHAVDPDLRLDGHKRVTLNNMVQDPTMMREHAYYGLAAALGVAAPRHGYARVTVNGADYGLYGLVETMDGQLLKRLYPDDPDGNLYESSGADFTGERDWFELEVDGGQVPVDLDIQALVAALDAAYDADFMAVLESRFETSALLRYLALDMMAGNDDGYVYNHNNYQAYHPAVADRWVLLPWGTDRSFTEEVSPYGGRDTPVAGTLARRCWGDDACSQELLGHLREVVDVWETGALAESLAATWGRIGDACEADPRRESACAPDDILTYVERRAAYVRERID
ncbi:MAG: CotH kinase family protein [Pseudomonadota bacterium]|nr:CotH kinase family protein [Pseudomonadota bacterium]